MARTNRNDALTAPAPSVDALDDLNLDDMFEGGDDSLFDGLDIDLDGMGELPGTLDERKKDAGISDSLDAMNFNLLGEPDEPSSTKRRKTKRKTKTPPPLEDESSEEILSTKKKRRSTKSANKKSRSKSKQKDEPPSPASSTTSSKSKSRTKTSKTMPPPMSRGTSGGQGMVAASGQFGGRAQKRGSYGTTQKGKSKTPSRPSSTGASPSRVRGNFAGSATKQTQEPTGEFGQQSTYCGLGPSATLFFPFMPALPPEPSLQKKYHRRYPCLDSISAIVSSQGNANDATPLSISEAENEALFKLILPEYDNQQPSASDPSSADMLRRASLATAIASARTTISQMDRSRLVNDLRSVCALLKRQHDFVGQSVENMERWCRDHLSVEDHAEVFGSPAALGGGKRTALTGSQLLGKNLARYGGAVLRVKIKCSGFKEPKMAAVLVARIPGATSRPSGGASSGQKVEGAKKLSSKKRKVSSTESSSDQRLSTGTGTPVVEEVLSYADLKPLQRRQQIGEAVAAQAVHLEKIHNEITQTRQVSLIRQENELQKVVQGDEIHPINTATLWEWVSKSSYFANYTESDINEVLHSAFQPELKDKDLREQDAPPVRLSRTRHDTEDTETLEMPSNSSAKPLFDRLQSLLVDVGSDDDTDDSDDEFDESWYGDGRISTMSKTQREQTPDDVADIPRCALLDFSELSVDERAYIQLRSIGLVDSPFLPSPNPVLIEVDEVVSYSEECEEKDEAGRMERNELDFVLRAMHSDLSQLQRLNNSRTALLRSQARKSLLIGQQSKKKQDEQAQQIAKYNQLMKKQKETKRSARQKTVKKHEDWVDW